MSMPSLRNLRERAGLTRAEAAENVGLAVDDIVDMETSDIDDLGQDDVDMYFEAIGFDPEDPDECFVDEDDDDDDDEGPFPEALPKPLGLLRRVVPID